MKELAVRAYAWTQSQALEVRRDFGEHFGDLPHLTPAQNFLRGAKAGALATLALTGAANLGLAAPNSGQQGSGVDFGGTDVKSALGKAIDPIKEAMCYIYNTAGPVVFLAAGIAVVLGFILKALQVRVWGVFVWGGVIAATGVGIVLAFISIFGNPKQACSASSS